MTVVGRNPSPALVATARAAGMTVTGTVDDVRPHIDEASVYVVPLRAGGGTRLKIFEALAMGKAVVSTSIGAEGLALTSGRQILIADGAEAFTASILEVLANDSLRQSLGAEGRRLVEDRYSWPQITHVFERALMRAAAHAAATSPPMPPHRALHRGRGAIIPRT